MTLRKLWTVLKKYLHKLYLIIVFPFSLLSIITFHYIEKSQFKIHENVITVSKRSKRDILKYYQIDQEKIKVLPNGVNLEKFNPNNYSEDIRDKYGNKIILYSGLMVERKNVPILLEAIKYIKSELPEVQLILTGEGEFLEDYKTLSKNLNIQNNTSFLGFVPDQKLHSLLATSDIFVFPSELEGFGQVIVESLASGTPVICADIPPMSDIIENAGKTFKINNPKNLANRVIELFENKSLYSKLEKNTLKVAEKYDWSNIAKGYQNYIKNVIDSKY